MHLTFRWYADDDTIPLRYIRQIPGMRGIVSALYDLAPGIPWPTERLAALRGQVEAEGLEFRVIESIPVHEEIKLAGPDRDRYIDAWMESLRAVGRALGPASTTTGSTFPPVVTYNFMPVFDWTRTDLAARNLDGSTSLIYDHDTVEKADPSAGSFDLPGWLARYTHEELARLISRYREVSPEDLWENLEYFLRAVVPVAEEAGVRLAIHPDDPPWPVFGLPRIVTDSSAMKRLLATVDSPANGLCLCSGSLGADPKNDVVAMARLFGPRVTFAHLRNVKTIGEGSFAESGHWSGSGSLDMGAIVAALAKAGFDGPVRPDHGRMIWGEQGKPGYGLYDRALGAAYILGLIESEGR
jgi:mannonate dehydratase